MGPHPTSADGATVLELAGFPTDESIDLTALLASAQGVGIIISIGLYHHLPRRVVFFGSCACVVLGLVLISVAFVDIDRFKSLAIFAVVFYLFSFGCGLSAAPHIIASEIFPVQARGVGMAQGYVAQWLTNFLVSATFLTEVESIDCARTFAIYAGISSAIILWLWFELPETFGQTIQEVWAQFLKQSPGGPGARDGELERLKSTTK